MDFQDNEIDKLKLVDADSIGQMIVEYLCGEKSSSEGFSEKDNYLLAHLLSWIKKDGINYEQFNELLLLLNQDRVSRSFFKFFFGSERIKLAELKRGITKFRGFAMLCLGNFRFAYKELISKNEEDLEESLSQYCGTKESIDIFTARPVKALEIEEITRDKTWYNGFLAKKKYDKEANYLAELLKAKDRIEIELSQDELLKLADLYLEMRQEVEEVERKALMNTDIYLVWDYMDIYIATSMRHKWEFEETYDFINKIFKDKNVRKLNLRYFDPTQSQCENRIDKGLIEGLMLKRANCTIYMAQEVDTMGKDSELAATLTQRKPVIAYVPDINITEHAKKVMDYPLDYFKLRFLVLRAEELFSDDNCIAELKKSVINFEEVIEIFLSDLDEYRSKQPFSLWTERENKFKQESKSFEQVCKLLAIAEHFSYEKRADTLRHTHPLALQVDLQTGVANGVLVVRNPNDCSELLYRILTNSMSFTIKHIKEKESGVTVLEEKISGCPFRVVTDYERLSNSFWNFYLISEN